MNEWMNDDDINSDSNSNSNSNVSKGNLETIECYYYLIVL